jgi:uncharacterized integral membrane protein
MAVVWTRVLRSVRSSLAVLVCALTAHAAAYRSFLPHDAVHGYVGVYDAAVGGLSALALASVGLGLLVLLVGKAGTFPALVLGPPRTRPFARSVAALSATGTAVLIVQEYVERAFASGSGLFPGTGVWLVAFVAIVLSSVVLVLLTQSCDQLILALLAWQARLPRAPARCAVPGRFAPARRRRNSLADFRGLRAPPSLSC